MRVFRIVQSDVDAVLAMPAGSGVLGMASEALRREFEAGRLRPEWTWVAVDDKSQLVGRALWWGRGEGDPVALEVLDTADRLASRIPVGVSLLRAGHDALTAGGLRPLPYTVRLPTGWRDLPDCVAAFEWRRVAAVGAGLTQETERLQVEWTRDEHASPSPSTRSRLTLRPGSDQEFLDLFARSARGSLDLGTQRALAATSAQELARDELDFYLGCPGERDWWRIAVISSHDPVGFVIPSATPYARNVGYVGVLPKHRGQGYVDELLEYATEFHRTAGAERITATTDLANRPMANAFARQGYRVIETRIVLEAPASGAAR